MELTTDSTSVGSSVFMAENKALENVTTLVNKKKTNFSDTSYNFKITVFNVHCIMKLDWVVPFLEIWVILIVYDLQYITYVTL